MTQRKKLIVGNWKMNLGMHEASLYVHKLAGIVPVHRDVQVVLAPPMIALQSLSIQIDRRQFKLAAQNFYWKDSGAFTGEVSAAQLRGIADFALVGHSERRHIFGETDKDIRAKVQAAVRSGITPILCVGETAQERADGETNAILHDQISGGLANLTADEAEGIVIAYEPVWAISSGTDFSNHAVATAGDASAAATAIRRQVTHLFGKKIAETVRVIYGGSASSQNASEFLQAHGIDGLLPGGASLRANEFAAMVTAAHEG